jgi:hypothetical protein
VNKTFTRIVTLAISASLALNTLPSSAAYRESSRSLRFDNIENCFLLEALAEPAIPFTHLSHFPRIPFFGKLVRFQLQDRLPTDRIFHFLYEGTKAQAKEPGHLDYTGPDWQRLNIVGAVALEKLEELHRNISFSELVEASRAALDDYYLPASDNKIHELIDYLVRIEVLSKGRNDYYHFIPAPDIVAIKLDAVEYISRHLHEALDDLRSDKDKGSQQLITLLRDFSRAVQHWPRYPVEAQLPILKAIRILPKADRMLLEQFLLDHDRLRDAPLVDAILLMFHHIPENWGTRMVPYLEGADLYLIACEIWNAVGGLARVTIFRAISMVRLLGKTFARVITHEPHYAYQAYDPDTPPEQQIPLDYAQLPTPVENLAQVDSFHVRVNNEDVPVSVSKGTNRYGIHITLIGDLWKVFTRAVYRHGHEFGARTKREFMSFYRQAVMQDILKEQTLKYEKAQREGLPYTPTVIFPEDGQMGPLVEYKRYLDRVEKAAFVLWYAVVFFFTHTVFHRELFDDEMDPGDHSPGGDATSKGVRSADAVAAVSAHHLDVTAAPMDPEARIVALTNGAFLEALNEYFMKIWDDLRAKRPELFRERGDPDDPTIEQYQEFKREAKRRVGLNPDQITVGSTGRLVHEKAGLKRAYENEEEKNVDAYVNAAAQVVLLANVQSHTKSLWEKLEKMAQDVNGKGYPGRLHIETGWGIPRQIEIMAALDVIVFDSDPDTEAAGLSEALATFFGAKVVGPSSLQGLINKQGMPKNKRHKGNTITPLNQSAKAFREAIMEEVRQYKDDPIGFSEEAIFSRTLSWVLNSDISTAWDLREANRAMSFKLNPLLALVPYLRREPESEKYFRHIWVRKQLLEMLEKNPEVTPFRSDNPDLKAFAVPFEVESDGVTKKITYMVNISLKEDPGEIAGQVWGAAGFTALVSPERANRQLQVNLVDTFTGKQLDSGMLGDVDRKTLFVIVDGGIEVLRMKRIEFPNSQEMDPFADATDAKLTQAQSEVQAAPQAVSPEPAGTEENDREGGVDDANLTRNGTSSGTMHPVGEPGFTAQELFELEENARQQGTVTLEEQHPNDRRLLGGWADEIRDRLSAPSKDPANAILGQLPFLRTDLTKLVNVIGASWVTLPNSSGDATAYGLEIHYAPSAHEFQTRGGRKASAFFIRDEGSKSIRLYVRDLEGLVHEGLEALIFPRESLDDLNFPRQALTPGQSHAAAVYAEAVVSKNPYRITVMSEEGSVDVVVSERVIGELDALRNDPAKKRAFLEGYEKARQDVQDTFLYLSHIDQNSGATVKPYEMGFEIAAQRYGLAYAKALHDYVNQQGIGSTWGTIIKKGPLLPSLLFWLIPASMVGGILWDGFQNLRQKPVRPFVSLLSTAG